MDLYWSDLYYHLSDGKPSEVAALERLPELRFYQLLDAHRRHATTT